MVEELIQSGVEAAGAGDIEKAREYFVKALQLDPKNVTGWLLLGNSLDDPAKKKYCFQRVLSFDPTNPLALNALADLTLPADQPQAAQPSPRPEVQPLQAPQSKQQLDQPQETPPTVTPVEASAPEEKTGRQKKHSSRPLLIVGGIGLLLLLAAFLFIGFSSGVLAATFQKISAGFLPTKSPTATITTRPSANPIPTNSSLPTHTALPTSTFQDTSTRTPTRTPRPTWTPFLSATPTFHPLVPNTGTPVLTSYGDIDYWDQFIQANPANANAYFQRAALIYNSADTTGSQENYLSQLDLALKDIDHAIVHRSDVGDYFALRQNILFKIGLEAESFPDSQVWMQMALDNAYKADQLGTTTEYPERVIMTDLVFTDQCQKALFEIQKLIPLVPAGDSSLGGLLQIRSQAYACLGKLGEALASVNDSMLNNADMDSKNELKFQYLIMLGRYDEALPILNELISKSDQSGWYSYWRAEIYYNTGKKDLVQAELDAGLPKTWLRGGMLPYVKAQLALDGSRKADGIELLQQAYATFPTVLNPLRWKIQDKLGSLGAKPLKLMPSVTYPSTPIP